MSTYNFSDKYLESGLAPTAEILESRKKTVARLLKSITEAQTLDLIRVYFGLSSDAINWFVEEFRKEDTVFSAASNKRECVILAACLIRASIDNGNDVALLGVLTTEAGGARKVTEANWLIGDVKQELVTRAVNERAIVDPETAKIKTSKASKLSAEVAGLPTNNWENLKALLEKMSGEAIEETKNIASQVTSILEPLNSRIKFLTEETQMLWWLYGGYSNILGRSYDGLDSRIGAVLAGLELADLAQYSRVGPVAAPTIIQRVLNLTKSPKPAKHELSAIVDEIVPSDLEKLPLQEVVSGNEVFFPVTTALRKGKEVGIGMWQTIFAKTTDLKPTIKFDQSSLSLQIYRESLLLALI